MKKTSYKRIEKLVCMCLILAMVLSLLVIISVAAGARQRSLAAGTSSGTITIGDTTFSAEENVTSGWKEGKGWKNLAGQYVVLVDYDGSEKEISMEGGVLTLGVAGVNRIKTLKSDHSINIFGTGIVLIDNIELGEGQTLSLMPNTALYETGSAAVFLKQGDEYVLINGDIPGILDEDYQLDGVDLRIPGGSSVILNATAIRKETWYSYDEDDLVTDVTRYKDEVPWQAKDPLHDGGRVELEGIAARLTLGNNSTLTVDDGASVRVEQVISHVMGIEFQSVFSHLVISGTLNNNGVIEGGCVDVNNGGSLSGSGTVLSSEVTLNAGGELSEEILLDTSGLTIAGEGMTVSAQIKDSAIYLKASNIYVSNLIVKGTSWVGIEPDDEKPGLFLYSTIGNITGSQGANLEIVANDHDMFPNNSHSARYVEDCHLEISGAITDCTVSVLAGYVEYTGSQKKNIPVVPMGYASRVYVTGFDIDSSLNPLIMSQTDGAGLLNPLIMSQIDGAELLKENKIPVMHADVYDTLISDRVHARKWVAPFGPLAPLEREANQEFTCASFLDAYNIQGSMSDNSYCTAVELIHSDLSRQLYFFNDDYPFSTEGVILIRVLNCIGKGGMGGSFASHTETSFTGSGTLGGTVDGSATTGKGTVVYPPNHTEPTTEETQPTTEEPEPTTKEPEPSTKEPETTTEKESTTAKDTSEKETTTGKKDNETGGTGAGNNQHFVQETEVVGTFGNARVSIEDETYPSAKTNVPVYRKLSVRIGGKTVTDLPEMITVETVLAKDETYGENLYVVFVDENENLKVFPAAYDKKEKKCRFETDETGNFVFVQLDDVPLSESELIKACRASDEVRILIMIMRLQAFWGR